MLEFRFTRTVGLDLYPNSDTCTWRLPDKTGMSYLEEYAEMLVLAGKGCGEALLDERLASVLSATLQFLLMGFLFSTNVIHCATQNGSTLNPSEI